MVLSFGGGLQTTALAIMASEGDLEVTHVAFADTGGEKPETYWYMENYTKPMLEKANIPFVVVEPQKYLRNTTLYDWMWRYRMIPEPETRKCSKHFKSIPIARFADGNENQMIGFSFDEQERSLKPIHKGKRFPLIERRMTGEDCRRLISNYGWPIPIKSSCFFCPFQRWSEWNWLKGRHPELIEWALLLEDNYYKRRPTERHNRGLFGGKPLWKWARGIQLEFPGLKEYSCWDGACGH